MRAAPWQPALPVHLTPGLVLLRRHLHRLRGRLPGTGFGFFAFRGGRDLFLFGAIGTLDSTGFCACVGIGGGSCGTGNGLWHLACWFR